MPERASDVVEDFQRFVEARPWVDHPELRRDQHFMPQQRSVRPEGINYTRIYDVSQLEELFVDLSEHLEALGLPAELHAPRANETALPLTRSALEPVRGVIEDAYRDDFEAFGHLWSPTRLKVAEGPWSPDASRLVQYQVDANERIGDLAEEARLLRKKLSRARRRLRRVQQDEQRPRRRLRLPRVRGGEPG